MEDRFYRLDNSAVFMAAISGASGPFVYRLSLVLVEAVRLDELQQALAAIAPRFPFLFVSLRMGVFWHYLEPVSAPPRIEKEGRFPAKRFPHPSRQPLVRVTVYGRRIACEFHHSVTDGTGAVAFLRALVVEYLSRRGIGADLSPEALAGIPRPGEAVDPEEEEDAYARIFKPSVPVPEKNPRAFFIPGRRRRRAYRETVGRITLGPALAAAKERKATLTELFAAVHIASLQELRETLPNAARRRSRSFIAVQIPINLRNIYPSRTLRNFFLFAAPSIDLRFGHWEFDEILHRVHHQLRIGMEEKELRRQLNRNVGGERNLFGRPMFLPIKTLILRAINAAIGVGAYSGSLSNMGLMVLPEPFSSRIESFAILPSRARTTGANICLTSWKDTLYAVIGSMVAKRDFERIFFRRLAALGLPVTVESSEPYASAEKG